MPIWLQPLLAIVRSYASAAVIDAIKTASLEAVTHGEWSDGEKTQFVIDAGAKVVQASSSRWDDILYGIATTAYLAKYASKKASAAPSATPTSTGTTHSA
jgi:hypothetical protein